jgi:hypothetical protein
MRIIKSTQWILVSNQSVIRPFIKILLLLLISIGTHKDVLFAQTRQQFLEKRKLISANRNSRLYQSLFKSNNRPLNLKLNIYSPLSGIATIDFYTISGVKIYEMKQNVIAGKSIVTDVKSLSSFTSNIIYKVSIGKYKTNGIIFSPSK